MKPCTTTSIVGFRNETFATGLRFWITRLPTNCKAPSVAVFEATCVSSFVEHVVRMSQGRRTFKASTALVSLRGILRQSVRYSNLDFPVCIYACNVEGFHSCTGTRCGYTCSWTCRVLGSDRVLVACVSKLFNLSTVISFFLYEAAASEWVPIRKERIICCSSLTCHSSG